MVIKETQLRRKMFDILVSILDRRTLWRLGRFLYKKARADTPNEMQSNGEQMIQRQLLNEFAKNSMTCVIFDVGANVGNWTWFILQKSVELKIDGRIEIYAFEPVASTFQTLQNRLGQSPQSVHIHLEPQALSSAEGISEMFVTGENAGTNSLHVDEMNKDAHWIEINKTTADAYCFRNNIKVIHYLKCDTEGHDMEVVYGARQLFQEERIMACQFEYNHRWIYSRHYLKDIFDFAQNMPYSIGKITPKGIEIFEEWHPELERFFEGNYMLIHHDALHWFRSRKGKFDLSSTYNV